MSIYDWEFWALGYFVVVTIFIIVFSRLTKINQAIDEQVEKHCKHTETPCDCLRYHQDEDMKESL